MNLLAFFVVLPLGAAFLLALRPWELLAPATTAVLAVLSFVALGQGEGTLCVGGWEPVDGVPVGIHMRLDGLAALMLLVINVVAVLAAVFSVRYMDRYTAKPKYWVLFLLMVAGMNAVVLSGDLFNLFVFMEVAAIASYALVAFGTGAEELEAAYKYQVMGALASALILLGIAFLYARTGTLNMVDARDALAAAGASTTTLFCAVLFLVGFGLKAAQVPFHAWLPDAHPCAPAPISAMLSGVLIKALGVYALIRVLFTVIGVPAEFSVALMTIGVLSMVVGVLLAIAQKDFKRLLAYSSISQVGYILLGLGIGSHLAVTGALLHLMGHATVKSLLFLNSGAVEQATGTRNLDELGGLRARMPVSSGTAFVGSLAISGVPPFCGFWSKLLIVIAAVQAGYHPLALVAVLVAALTLATYLKVQGTAYRGALPQALEDVRDVAWSMRVPLVALAVLSLVLGILLLEPFRSFLLDPAVDVVLGAIP